MAEIDIKPPSGGGRVFAPNTDHQTDSDSLCSEFDKINKLK